MELYTIQNAQWRKAKNRGILLHDTSVKTGTSIFAPTWPMVIGYKEGVISEREYTDRYVHLMRQRFNTDPHPWREFVKQDIVAIGCMCCNGVFCHRYLLKDLLSRYCNHIGIQFIYKGEIT